MPTPLQFYTSIQLASTVLGVGQAKKAAQLQREQLEQQKLQQRIAASDATQQRLAEMSKAIASQQASAAAMGLAPSSVEQKIYDEAQIAAEDIDAINFNLESFEAQANIAQAEARDVAQISSLDRIATTGASIFDTLRLNG